jgi:hypothetical protein
VLAQCAVSSRRDPKPGAGGGFRRGEDTAEVLERRAVAALGRAADSSYFNNVNGRKRLQRDPDLNPLRSRSEFRLLMLDLMFPSEPFGRGG